MEARVIAGRVYSPPMTRKAAQLAGLIPAFAIAICPLRNA